MPEALAPAVVTAPSLLYRVGKSEGPIHFSHLDPIAAELPDVGNRFDVLGAGVMYASTEQVGAYKETIAFARPSASSHLYGPLKDEHYMNAGNLPADWRARRRLLAFALEDDLPFIDLEADETLSYLTEAMAETLHALEIELLDQSVVRGPNRILTRAIASHIYTAVDSNDEALYSGIRYASRFGSHEAWAIFEGVRVEPKSFGSIEANDPYLRAACRAMNVTVH
ncbi:RES domain-containing protein [Protaetiibacter intestinalis]|uniref:RES domain-containing protein n=1 Tax=Protaetiibacter intestinalis TaxID=2419774 RepID=A0A387BB03_9MICO|nr:RES domain-containing protein [Protaetiibacter intestinalis]AYF98119.1 RES domain-containing protein [Protaetiibacter intestinalis]